MIPTDFFKRPIFHDLALFINPNEGVCAKFSVGMKYIYTLSKATQPLQPPDGLGTLQFLSHDPILSPNPLFGN